MCEGGKCICDPGYKGQYCTINVMKLLFIWINRFVTVLIVENMVFVH